MFGVMSLLALSTRFASVNGWLDMINPFCLVLLLLTADDALVIGTRVFLQAGDVNLGNLAGLEAAGPLFQCSLFDLPALLETDGRTAVVVYGVLQRSRIAA